MVTAQANAAALARELREEAEKLRVLFDRSLGKWNDVTFEGPSAAMFALRMEERMKQVRSLLAEMGEAADGLHLNKKAAEPGGKAKTGGTPAPTTGKAKKTKGDDGNGKAWGWKPGDGTLDYSKLPANFRKYKDEVEAAAKKYGIHPALLMAVMDRETGDPKKIGLGAKNILGDAGHGHGLMQIDDRSHAAWLNSHDWRNAKQNIDYGASVLASSIKSLGGNVHAGLAGYNGGPGRVAAALKAGRSADSVTTGGNYGSDVWRRYQWFKDQMGG